MTNDKPISICTQARLQDSPEGTSKEEIARHEALALDALVAAGKIREARPHKRDLYCQFHR